MSSLDSQDVRLSARPAGRSPALARPPWGGTPRPFRPPPSQVRCWHPLAAAKNETGTSSGSQACSLIASCFGRTTWPRPAGSKRAERRNSQRWGVVRTILLLLLPGVVPPFRSSHARGTRRPTAVALQPRVPRRRCPRCSARPDRTLRHPPPAPHRGDQHRHRIYQGASSSPAPPPHTVQPAC